MKYATGPLIGILATSLEWMTGIWHGKLGANKIEEHWSRAAGGTLMGMFRWLKGNSIWFYELLVIEPDRDQLVIRIKHFNPGLQGWEEKDQAVSFSLVELDSKKAVFIQQGKPEPVWLIYALEKQDTLITYFEKEDEPVKEEEIFVFTRTSS